MPQTLLMRLQFLCRARESFTTRAWGQRCCLFRLGSPAAADLSDALALDGAAVALPLQGERCDQPLDLGRLGVLLAVLLLRGAVGLDVLAHVVVLGQVEELADFGGPLGPAHARLLLVCQPRNLALAYSRGTR